MSTSPGHGRSSTPRSIRGSRFFDTADIYGRGVSEEFLGEILRGRRDRVILATKGGMDMGDGKGPRGSREYLRQAFEASLRRLDTDVVDYYWYHEPDGVTPIAETLETLHEFVTAGKARAIGASNFTAAQLEEADAVARENGLTRFSAVQNEYNLLVREAEDEVLPACERLGIGFVPFFPLASGLLTGKYRRRRAGPRWRAAHRSSRDRDRRPVRADRGAARVTRTHRGVTLAEVAIGALLARDVVSSVIAGATRPEQVTDQRPRPRAGSRATTTSRRSRDLLAATPV